MSPGGYFGIGCRIFLRTYHSPKRVEWRGWGTVLSTNIKPARAGFPYFEFDGWTIEDDCRSFSEGLGFDMYLMCVNSYHSFAS